MSLNVSVKLNAEANVKANTGANMKFAYFPGCSAKTSGKEYAESTKRLFKKLGIELLEFDTNCCGTHIVEEYNRDTWLALNARNMSIAETLEADIVTTCPACYQNLKKSKMELEVEGVRDKINTILSAINKSYSGKVNIYHVVEILSKLNTNKLEINESNLRVAAYYGCQILRPPELGIDNPEAPTIFEDLLEKFGVKTVEFKAKTECCGGPLLLLKSEVVKSQSMEIAREAKNAGADCIVTLCPLCQFSLEVVQDKMPVKPFTLLLEENLKES